MNAAEPPMDLAPPLIETQGNYKPFNFCKVQPPSSPLANSSSATEIGPHGLFVARIYSFERLGARGIPGRYALCLFFQASP